MIGGRLDRRISVLRKSVTLSASGEPIETWTPVLRELAASMAPVRGEERFTGEQYVALEQTEFRVRWRAELVGLSPLDRIVERLRSASERTQLLLATHSPTLVNRLAPEELIICERDPDTGASLIPAIDPSEVRSIAAEDELGLGELWFTGTLGGVPP